jgi:general secretion pathway protein B
MSFILEALKKVEREREAAGPRSLGAVQRISPPRRPVWPWVVGLALVVNAGVLWTLWRPAEQIGPAKEMAPAAPTSETTEPRPVDAGPAKRPPKPERPKARRAAAPEAVAPPRPRPVLPKPPPAAPITAPEPPAPAAESTPAVAAPAGGETLPLFIQMPADFRAQVKDLAINLMAYSDEPSERLVYINSHRYTEGERVEGKLQIEAITREGVVLSHQGKRCLLPR